MRVSEVIDMAESTTDHSILKKIEGLVHEEQHLYGKGELADHDQVRLEAIKIELDQCWDLLRQREARREFGRDPNEAKGRPSLALTDPDYTRKCPFAADAAIDGGGGRPSRVRSATRLRAERSLDSGAHYRPAVCRFEIS